MTAMIIPIIAGHLEVVLAMDSVGVEEVGLEGKEREREGVWGKTYLQ